MKDTFLTPLMLRVEGDNKRPPGANVERTSRPALFISISNTSFNTSYHSVRSLKILSLHRKSGSESIIVFRRDVSLYLYSIL